MSTSIWFTCLRPQYLLPSCKADTRRFLCSFFMSAPSTGYDNHETHATLNTPHFGVSRGV
jgi:hypothetical protein